jgi:2-oxo-4-hydroxy-4-carboxy--5-ureidoimidazoline (OHCU) decarboxylase
LVTSSAGPPPLGFPTIAQLDGMPAEDFTVAVAPLFEGAPHFLGRLADVRPFATADRLFEAARRIAHSMPEAEQVELVDAHPRLGAPPESISSLSYREQGYHRATPPAGTLAADLERLNDAYEDQFGFRCCIFVAGRSRAALLPEMEARLADRRHEELHRGLDAVIDIARDRWRTLAEPGARAGVSSDG